MRLSQISLEDIGKERLKVVSPFFMNPVFRSIVYTMLAVIAFGSIVYSISHHSKNNKRYEQCTKSAKKAAFGNASPESGVDSEEKSKNAKAKRQYFDDTLKCFDLHAQWEMSDTTMM